MTSRQTRAEIEDALLRGKPVTWSEGKKREALQLSTAVQRRLFRYLLESQVRVAKGLPDSFIEGLKITFESSDDPATALSSAAFLPREPGPWKLSRIETSGFGGINIWGGPVFTYSLGGESLIIDGPNGSGKSSFAGALTWGMRGERSREAGPASVVHAPADVFDQNGAKLGSWPPLACYPSKAADILSAPAVVSVKLTFTNPADQEASIDRTLSNGRISTNADSRLDLPPVLVETGLMMPARLAQIRWGTGDQQLTDAVQMLTGLDEIANLGDFVGDLCHKGRDYLNYSKTQRRDDFQRQFDEALKRTNESLQAVGLPITKFAPSETREENGAMAAQLQTLKNKAGDAVAIISADLDGGLDLSSASVQRQVVSAIEAAKSEVTDGLSGLSCWSMAVTISDALTRAVQDSFTQAIANARLRLTEAQDLQRQAGTDSRFQLKALAAAWHEQHASGDIENCPLCEKSLSDQPALLAEIDSLRSAGAAARKEYEDNVNAITTKLTADIPLPIRNLFDQVKRLRLPEDINEQLRDKFVKSQRYEKCLTGVSKLIEAHLSATPNAPLAACPEVTDSPSPATSSLLRLLDVCDQYLKISNWMTSEKSSWESWWVQVTTGLPSAGQSTNLSDKLKNLDAAVGEWTPYAAAVNALKDAWRAGQIVDQIDQEQSHRQQIADSLESLKSLRKLAEFETKAAIEGLSGRMEKFLDEIYISEKLKFSSAHFDKKTGVSVRGEFDPELTIDASLVANSSWIRALLWAFLFSLREEAVEQLGEDRLPVLVLDDPQATFDVTHRHRWIQRIGALQKSTPSLQLIVATHDEAFLDQMNTLGIEGRRTHLSAAGKDIGHLHLVDGAVVERAWELAQSTKSPDAGRGYIEKARVYIEGILKVMLRGEADTRTMTMGKLRERIEQLHKSKVTPWNRPVFKELVNQLSGPSEVKYLESSHHTTGSSLGMGEAVDVEKFWRTRLSPQIEKAFRQIREYRLLHGESKALFASVEDVAIPNGYRDAVRAAPIELVGRASALSGGRIADGTLSLVDLGHGSRESIVLGNHEAFRLVTPTLEPVARPGDVLLVASHGEVLSGSLVVATCGDALLARRFQKASEHPDVAVLVAQAITPSAIASPFIAHLSTVGLKKIVGVIFDQTTFPASASNNQEIADCGGDSIVRNLLKELVGMVAITGSSAEPHALHGQHLLIGTPLSPEEATRRLDGQLVIATDSDGAQYFKRLRVISEGVILESLHASGQYPPVLLAMPGHGDPHIARVLPVLGILFERP